MAHSFRDESWSAVAGPTATAVGGAALGWAAERRFVGTRRVVADPERGDLASGLPARTVPVTSLDGTVLHAEVVGDDAAPTLVLVHGYGLGQRVWDFQRHELADEFRVVTYDQRGHGASAEAADGDYSIEALGADLAAVVTACVTPGVPAVVAGHAMGAMAVLAAFVQRGEALRPAVAGVVLVNPTIPDSSAGSRLPPGTAGLSSAASALLPRLLAFRRGRMRRPTDLTYLLTRALNLAPHAAPAHVALTEELILTCPAHVWAALIAGQAGVDVEDAARSTGVPVRMLVGERDRRTSLLQAHRLLGLLPQAELVALAGVGHMALLEAHETVTAHLRAFARGVLGVGTAGDR